MPAISIVRKNNKKEEYKKKKSIAQQAAAIWLNVSVVYCNKVKSKWIYKNTRVTMNP